VDTPAPLIIQADVLAYHDLAPVVVVAHEGRTMFASPWAKEIASGRPIVLRGARRAAPATLRRIYELAGLGLGDLLE
jgi:NADPH-dependent ferric siderophore reductase